MKKMRRKEKRIFFTSFFSTLCVLALLAGIMAVDVNSRRIGFGDDNTLFYRATGQSWSETCNAVKMWYNDFVSTITAKNDAEVSR